MPRQCFIYCEYLLHLDAGCPCPSAFPYWLSGCFRVGTSLRLASPRADPMARIQAQVGCWKVILEDTGKGTGMWTPEEMKGNEGMISSQLLLWAPGPESLVNSRRRPSEPALGGPSKRGETASTSHLSLTGGCSWGQHLSLLSAWVVVVGACCQHAPKGEEGYAWATDGACRTRCFNILTMICKVTWRRHRWSETKHMQRLLAECELYQCQIDTEVNLKYWEFDATDPETGEGGM